jgi:hypothetical protein
MAPLPSGVTSIPRFKFCLCRQLQHPLFLTGINEIAYMREASLNYMLHIHKHHTEYVGVFSNILATVYGSHGCSSVESIVPSLTFQLLYSVILARKVIISLVTDGLVVLGKLNSCDCAVSGHMLLAA